VSLLLADAGTTWSKLYEAATGELRIVPTRTILEGQPAFHYGTGHVARERSRRWENDLLSLARGALALVPDDGFTVLDVGSRDIKYASFVGRRVARMDWSVGCAAAAGATIEMLCGFYGIDLRAVPAPGATFRLTCATYSLERVMDAVARGGSPADAIGQFVHGLAARAWELSGSPAGLYLSGGFCESPAFLSCLARYARVVPLGRTVPLAGLWESAREDGAVQGPLPRPLCPPRPRSWPPPPTP
jgi:hypothetical protein